MATRTSSLTVLALTLATLLTGCGEKHFEVVDRYTSEFDSLRAELAEIATLIPEKVSPSPAGHKVEPQPTFKSKSLKSNAAIVMYDQLLDPDIDLRKAGKLEFHYSGHLMRNLAWTGPKNPMSEKYQKKTARESLEPELKHSLGLRYIGIVRTLKHVPPVVVDKDNFKGGGIIMGLFLVDRQSKEIVAQGIITAETDKQVNYKYSESSDPATALQNWANSSLWENATEASRAKFIEMTGGTFD